MEESDDSADFGRSPKALPQAGADTDLRRSYLEEQVNSRRASGDSLMRRAREILEQRHGSSAAGQAEADARRALAAYRASLDWAEDSDLEDEAHRQLDLAGRWVRETFGCWVERSGTEYKQTCPVALGHNRIGLSIGGTASIRTCSLCGEDVSECEHLPGTAYLVPGGPNDLGWCRVCLKEECDHLPTEIHRASVVSIIREMEVVEVSIVHKPAHPEARLHAVSIGLSQLQAALGDLFEPGMDVSCDRCLPACDGLTRHDLPHA